MLHNIRLQTLSSFKHSNLLAKFVSYKEKSVLNTAPGSQRSKYFFWRNLNQIIKYWRKLGWKFYIIKSYSELNQTLFASWTVLQPRNKIVTITKRSNLPSAE